MGLALGVLGRTASRSGPIGTGYSLLGFKMRAKRFREANPRRSYHSGAGTLFTSNAPAAVRFVHHL
jgi:hypothetical protein